MSQASDFEAQVLSELGARSGSALGLCLVCREAVLLEENFMRVDGRVAHVICPRARSGGELGEAGRVLGRWRHDKRVERRRRFPVEAWRGGV